MLRCEAIGRLTADPVLKNINLGGDQVAVCEFSIAVNYGSKENQQTEYIDCQAWRGLGTMIGTYAKKGRKVYVAGKQKTRRFEIEKDGVTFNDRRVEWNIDDFEFCDDKTGGSQNEAPAANAKPYDNTKVPF
jgi:single-strand DNA-binding protein